MGATIAQPTALTIERNCNSEKWVRSPGMASSLSRVPPVWPKPRPEIIGTKAPTAASIGAKSSETASPTPPVECLSITFPGRSQLNTLPLSRMPNVSATRPASSSPCKQTAMAKAPACASVTRPFPISFAKRLMASGSTARPSRRQNKTSRACIIGPEPSCQP